LFKTMRRRLGLIFATTAALTGAGLMVQSPASAVVAYGAEVHRSTTIERAADWNSRNVQYSESTNPNDAVWDENHGRKYRPDCSGFVAMAWKLNGGDPLGSSGIFTQNLDNYAHNIDYNDMLPGDALLRLASTAAEPAHVMLFQKWSSGFDSMWIYEESGTRTDMEHKVITASWFHSNGYKAIRYDHIIRD
jgi:hypothetical protein